jgi:hypothetical protein
VPLYAIVLTSLCWDVFGCIAAYVLDHDFCWVIRNDNL